MSADKPKAVESLESWLSGKPYWEQYVWKVNLEKEVLSEKDIDQCHEYLCEHLGLIAPLAEKKPIISFKNQAAIASARSGQSPRIQIREMKNLVDVNAISKDCSIKFGPNLTLIYGGNGSGKSGAGRLLCNACFSRGEREILPNVKDASISKPQTKARFVIDDGSGALREIEYAFGEDNNDLRRFSVFDSKSVLIHLDQSNNVNFTPAQIQIFDRVADTISKLEEKLLNEKNARKKANPFQSMFLEDATSDTAIFCKGINAETKEADFLKHAQF